MNGSGKDWIGLVIGEHWITWESHYENIGVQSLDCFQQAVKIMWGNDIFKYFEKY